MLGKFFVITTNLKDGPKAEAIQSALEGYDWLRFSPNTYYVYAYSVEPKDLYEKVKPVVGSSDDLLVVEVQAANRHGWVSQIAVDWFTRVRV